MDDLRTMVDVEGILSRKNQMGSRGGKEIEKKIATVEFCLCVLCEVSWSRKEQTPIIRHFAVARHCTASAGYSSAPNSGGSFGAHLEIHRSYNAYLGFNRTVLPNSSQKNSKASLVARATSHIDVLESENTALQEIQRLQTINGKLWGGSPSPGMYEQPLSLPQELPTLQSHSLLTDITSDKSAGSAGGSKPITIRKYVSNDDDESQKLSAKDFTSLLRMQKSFLLRRQAKGPRKVYRAGPQLDIRNIFDLIQNFIVHSRIYTSNSPRIVRRSFHSQFGPYYWRSVGTYSSARKDYLRGSWPVVEVKELVVSPALTKHAFNTIEGLVASVAPVAVARGLVVLVDLAGWLGSGQQFSVSKLVWVHHPKRTAKAPKFNLHGGDDMWEEH
ncbi:hypothetical protein B0H13DRAFT_1910302 [Mycena leptocephala]|nr:hypothetical protein B0H13DRAFT_1910302 [Mycena leptocephala]